MNSYIHIFFINDEPVRNEITTLVHEAVGEFVSNFLQTYFYIHILLFFCLFIFLDFHFAFAPILPDSLDHLEGTSFFQNLC